MGLRCVNRILLVLGGPGSGKGTQCTKIAEEFDFFHLCAGDLLRAEVAKGTAIGKELEATMKEGKLVPAVRPTCMHAQYIFWSLS